MIVRAEAAGRLPGTTVLAEAIPRLEAVEAITFLYRCPDRGLVWFLFWAGTARSGTGSRASGPRGLQIDRGEIVEISVPSKIVWS